MNVLPALADYLQQYIPEFYWIATDTHPNTIESLPYIPNTIRLKASITQNDNLLKITDLNSRYTSGWTEPTHGHCFGDHNPEIVDLYDKHFTNKILCILHMWIAQQNPTYPGITTNRIDFV